MEVRAPELDEACALRISINSGRVCLSSTESISSMAIGCVLRPAIFNPLPSRTCVEPRWRVCLIHDHALVPCVSHLDVRACDRFGGVDEVRRIRDVPFHHKGFAVCKAISNLSQPTALHTATGSVAQGRKIGLGSSGRSSA